MNPNVVPDPIQRAGDQVRPYFWALLGVTALTIGLLQMFGPLPAAQSTVLLLAFGVFALVWNVLVLRARSTLEFASRHAWKLIAAFAIVAVAIQALGLLNAYWETIAIELFLFAILALSWDLLGGQTGYPSFGNIAFFGMGAYTSAILLKDFATGLPVAVIAGAVAALVFAALVGAAVLRLKGGYFAIATLGVALATQQIVTNLEITGGSSGRILLDVPPQTVYYYALLATLVVEVVLVYYLTSTRFGYTLNSIRDDEEKATAMGINTTYYKTSAWMIASLFTGIAGGLYAPYLKFIDPNVALSNSWNVELIVMAFVGGTGTVAGPIIGAFGLRTLTKQIETLFPAYQLVVLGLVVLVTVIVFPQGLVGQLKERASEMEYYKHGGSAAGQEQSETPEPDAALDGGDD
ncbi:MAG: branched-chain amino acid transport system permease protein [Haloarculaceae archaeon]|jgi:branched-chain amino acid transport system permease protein